MGKNEPKMVGEYSKSGGSDILNPREELTEGKHDMGFYGHMTVNKCKVGNCKAKSKKAIY